MSRFDDYCEECGDVAEVCTCHDDEETSLETLARWQIEELRSM